MNIIKKIILLFAITIIAIKINAQTTTIYGKVLKGDGSRLKGTAVIKGYEDQLIINNFTGGSDNTATIEIEVPTAAYMADFRSMMNTAPKQTLTAKPAAVNVQKQPGTSIAIAPGNITTQSHQAFPISRFDISVTSRVGNAMPTLSRQIFFENVIVEACTDIATSNTSKIKLKANRIGWIYYTADPVKGTIKVTGKSGWDNVAGIAWNNF